MMFPAAIGFFIIPFVALALRWVQALSKSQRAAALALGIDIEPSVSRDLASELWRLHGVRDGIERAFDLGRIDDPEANRWHRIARNRYWLLMTAVTFSGPPLLLSLLVGAQGSIVTAMPAIPMSLVTWAVAVGVAGYLLRGDAPLQPGRQLRILGAIAVADVLALLAPFTLPH